jgi:cysteine-rich repeat protein
LPVVKKSWMALIGVLMIGGVPACATGNDAASATSSGGGSAAGGGDAVSSSSSSGTGGSAAVCGDGKITAAEGCDDGNTDEGDGCDSHCEFETPGWDCSGTPTVCVAKCGDGFLVGTEKCDDGNAKKSDGCSETCTVDNGYACSGTPSVCAPVCGDGILAGKEECDDQNAAAADGCSDLCKLEKGWICVGQPSICTASCGDGIIAGAEACDDHNFLPGDGCDAACAIEPFWTCSGEPSACSTPCGDGNVVGTELCDDKNLAGGDGCSAVCTPEAGFTCVGMPSKCTTICGDGVAVMGIEACDDGNIGNGDGCNAVCKVEPGFTCSGTTPTKCITTCGDGYPAGTETCDVGAPKLNDGCDDNCHAEHGYVCSNVPSICTTVCGDGLVGGAEQCDDGNNVGNDGCSPTCTIVAGYTCAGEPSMCITKCGDGVTAGAEQCDDGNLVNGDCCSSACGAETGCEIEVNDVIGMANDFSALAITSTVKGTIKPANDLDYYMVTVPAGQTAGLTAATLDGYNSSCVNLTQDSFLTVFDVNGIALGTDDNSGPGNCAQVQIIGLTGGDYFVEVKAAAAQQFSYALTIQVQVVICGNGTKEPGEQCDDGNLASGDGCSSLCKIEVANEIEPNNTPAQALANGPFPTNRLWVGAVTPIGDKDYYAILITSAVDITIETFDGTGAPNCASGHDTEIRLFASNGLTQLSSDDDTGPGVCSQTTAAVNPGNRHLLPGTYYISVEEHLNDSTVADYQVQITFTAVCGNGIKEGYEECDGTPNCNATCSVVPLCGDGIVSGTEACDDGNFANGDGCSSACLVEPGFVCPAGSPSSCMSIITCPAPKQLLVFNATGLPHDILDSTTFTSTINVPTAKTVSQAVLQIDISHTYDADLDITLKSPASATGIDITSDNGVGGDNYTNTVFSDSCVPLVVNGTAPFSSCYKPEALLSSFVGQPSNGAWVLGVGDDASGDTGTLNAWKLTLCVQ